MFCGSLCLGLARYLAPPGQLLVYGLFLEQGVPTSPGNVEFDKSLRARNPAWGVRSLEAVSERATVADLHLLQRFQKPANNLLLVFGR